MDITEICNIKNRLQNLVDSHPSELADCASEVLSVSSEELMQQYNEKMNPHRLLHIGLVGRVKAGKSSLLNSLFFGGKDILPKAATPMTAALTMLNYSEKPYVKINFFTQDDYDRLKTKAADYNRRLEEKTKEIFAKKAEKLQKKGEQFDENELMEKARKLAAGEFSENIVLSGAADQYQMIQNAGDAVRSYIGHQSEIIELDSIEDVGSRLGEYVGSTGKYTAVTNNVEIGFPFETLKDITVVDTPGFDDPVPSRDAQARNALKKCDVIFILSPAGQFCNQEDKNNIEKIEKGEAVPEIHVIASKIDSELGNESMDAANGNIKEEIRLITETIQETLKSLIDSMHGTSTVFEALKKSAQQPLLYTSGICQSLYETWSSRREWKDEESDVWERLKETYPDAFESEDDSAKEQLRIIGNVDVIHQKILDVRSKKDEILAKVRDDFTVKQLSALREASKEMLDYLKEKVAYIKASDINEIKAEAEKQQENYAGLKEDFTEILTSIFDDYAVNCREVCNQIVQHFYSGTKDAAKKERGHADRTGTRTESKDCTVQVKDAGFGGIVKRTIGVGGYHDEIRTQYYNVNYNYTVRTINASEVRSILCDFATGLRETLEIEVDKRRNQLKAKLKSGILEIWAKYQIQENLGNATRNAQANLILSKIPDCDLGIDWKLPESLQSGGMLEEDEADSFWDRFVQEQTNVKTVYTDAVKDFLSDIKSTFDAATTTELILSKMKENIDKLLNEVSNKNATLDNYNRIYAEVEEFSKSLY